MRVEDLILRPRVEKYNKLSKRKVDSSRVTFKAKLNEKRKKKFLNFLMINVYLQKDRVPSQEL